MLARLLGRIDRIAGIDIYLADIDPGDDRAVRDWAAQHGIDPEWVRTRKVTLNFEAGALPRSPAGEGRSPA
jgi:integrating conjugative element protein (TIGR03759 family)